MTRDVETGYGAVELAPPTTNVLEDTASLPFCEAYRKTLCDGQCTGFTEALFTISKSYLRQLRNEHTPGGRKCILSVLFPVALLLDALLACIAISLWPLNAIVAVIWPLIFGPCSRSCLCLGCCDCSMVCASGMFLTIGT